jgi:hypothetical protein
MLDIPEPMNGLTLRRRVLPHPQPAGLVDRQDDQNGQPLSRAAAAPLRRLAAAKDRWSILGGRQRPHLGNRTTS